MCETLEELETEGHAKAAALELKYGKLLDLNNAWSSSGKVNYIKQLRQVVQAYMRFYCWYLGTYLGVK